MTEAKPPPRELFEAALALAPAERAAFLAEHVVDPAQRAIIERMLAADEDGAARVLDDSFDELLGRVGDSDCDDACPPTGSTVGPFTLEEKLGEGGSSIVFRATREQAGVTQTVALKLLRRGLYTNAEKRRFRSERLALAQLRHPGIARLIEGGVTDSAIPYIALELIDGEAITDHAREKRLDLRRRLQLFVAVCRAVEAAHRALIVHRDLKPSNVLVTREGEVKLLDFGIAKLLDADADDDATRTQHAAMTPAYAAPEQFSHGIITTATDVYALGILLAELITGTRREAGDSRTPSSRISEDSAPGVLPAAPKVTRRQLRGDLDNVVLKATALAPQQRYASAGAFADDIERHLAGQPVAAHPPSSLYRARKFVTRHKGGVLLTAAFLLAVVAALGLALWQANVAREQARIARDQAQRAEAVRQFLVGVFEQAEPDAHKGQAISAHQLLDRGEQQLRKQVQGQTALSAELTALIGRLYWDLGDYAHAQKLLQAAVATGADPLVPDAIKARSLRWLARTENDQHAFDAAIGHANEAIALAERGGSTDAEEAGAARRTLVDGIIGRGDCKDAEPLARAELARDRAAHGETSMQTGADWLLLARALDCLSRFDDSADAFAQAIRIDRAVHGERSSRVGGDLNALGLMLWEKRDFAGSERALREALDIDQKVYGAEHAETLAVRSNLIETLEYQDRWQEVLDARLQLLDIQKRVLGDMHPDQLADAYDLIGSSYRMLGRYREAQDAARASLTWWTKAQGPGGTDSAQALFDLAIVLQLDGLYADAGKAFGDALAIQQKHESPSSRILAKTRGALANNKRLEHRYDEAVRELDSVIATVEGVDNGNDRIIAVLQAQRSEALLDAGDAERAQASATEALARVRKARPGEPAFSALTFALARADLALSRAAEAEPLLREALAERQPGYPSADPRVLEVKVALVGALEGLGRTAEARQLRAEIEPLLKQSTSPYAADLRRRLVTSRR